MKYLIVGLGNKGAEYEETRHNIGFKVAEQLAKEMEVGFSTCQFGWMVEGKYKGKKVLVLKPDTYMNLSGNAVGFWMQKEKIPVENVLIVTDDLHLPFGTLRLKTKGSNAGHNGLKSVEEKLNSAVYNRLRFGISAAFADGKQVDYVLGKWNQEEITTLNNRVIVFAKCCLNFVFAGVTNTMTAYNGK